MKISNQALAELRILLRADYPDTEFSDAELLEIALNLLQNVKLVYGNSEDLRQSQDTIPLS